VAADARADELARTLGRALGDRRRHQRMTQAQVADAAAVAPSTVSAAERGGGAGYTIRTWTRLARSLEVDLRAYLDQASAAGQPRDIVHLRNQELLIRTAASGGWRSRPEHTLGDPTRGARSIDVLLTRPLELAVMEVFDWFEDVGAAARSWDRKLARIEALALARLPPPVQGIEVPLPRVSGCWVVRATRRNRELVAAHPALFHARLPGSRVAWLRALAEREVPMPADPALLWVAVGGEKLWPARFGSRVD